MPTACLWAIYSPPLKLTSIIHKHWTEYYLIYSASEEHGAYLEHIYTTRLSPQAECKLNLENVWAIYAHGSGD